MSKKAIAIVVAFVVALALVVFVGESATGQENHSSPVACGTPAKDAVYDEVLVKEATPGSPAVPPVTETIPGKPEVWEVWSPNNSQGPQDYVPNWPVDNPGGESRGTWQSAAEHIPPGHAGPDGVYQQGGGNSPFFYRQAGTEDKVVVVTPGKDAVPATDAEYKTVLVTPAVPAGPPCDNPDPSSPPRETVDRPDKPVLDSPENADVPEPRRNSQPVEVPTSVDAGI